MKILFLSAAYSLRISGDVGRGIRVWGDLFITNNRSHIADLMTSGLRAIIGTLETEALEKAGAVIFQVENAIPGPKTTEDAITYLNRLTSLTTLFLNCLWLVKDNSANIEQAFIEYPHRDPFAHVTSNSRGVYYSNCAGCRESVTFSADEIRKARDALKMYGITKLDDVPAGSTPVSSGNTSRIDRVMYYLQAARTSSDLSVKISHLMTCFEALLCTDSAELSHKLSERASFFLGGSPESKLAIYQDLKAAYTVRSKSVHGDRLPDKYQRDLERLVSVCDSYLRRVVSAVLASEHLHQLFQGSADRIEKYMNELLFGIQAPVHGA